MRLVNVIKWQDPPSKGPRSALGSKPRSRIARPIEGSTILYHYLQKDLLNNDIWLFQMLVARLIVALGIWLSPEIYSRLPIVLPFAARDPHARGNVLKRIPDQWGSAAPSGLFRDDNSLVKGLPRTLLVRGRGLTLYDGRQIGGGFVASHVWRETEAQLAARHPMLYSFVPNLVWLPTDVAKLSDREGSFVQSYLQALSLKIYRRQEVSAGVREFAEQAWAFLPAPAGVPQQGLPNLSDLNFFMPSVGWIDRRIRRVEEVVAALDKVEANEPLGHVVASRYGPSLMEVPAKVRQSLRQRLAEYTGAARSAIVELAIETQKSGVDGS